MKSRTIKILTGILDDKEFNEDENEFASMIHPKKLTGRYNDEIKYDQSFEQNCIVLGKFINQPVKTLTTKEYFTLIKYYNDQTKR